MVWEDPAPTSTIQASSHHSQADFNIYEGMKVKGEAKYVFKKGYLAIADGALQQNLPKGKPIKEKHPNINKYKKLYFGLPGNTQYTKENTLFFPFQPPLRRRWRYFVPADFACVKTILLDIPMYFDL